MVMTTPQPGDENKDTKDGSSKTGRIVRRISAESGVDELEETLSSLSPGDLSSLLLAVYKNHAAKKAPKDILDQYTDNVLTNPGDADPLKIHDLERVFYGLARGFDRVDLSILNPLGANAVVSDIDHKTLFSAVRNAEVLADISVALSLEAAKRRRVFRKLDSVSDQEVTLAAAQRIARMRQRPTASGYNAHWKMIGLASASREEKSGYVAKDLLAIKEHVKVYAEIFKYAEKARKITVLLSDISLMDDLIKENGLKRTEILLRTNNGASFGFKDMGVDLPGWPDQIDKPVLDFLRQKRLKNQIFRLNSLSKLKDELQDMYPDVHFCFNLERTAGMGYYRNLCFHLKAENDSGEVLVMVDGGNVDWTQKMLCDKRETAFVSGMGSELFIRKFGWTGAELV